MKKGVSPLIASVLIIAFVIILFGLITTWVRQSAIEPSMQASEEKVAGELECAKQNIKIVEACVNNINSPSTVKLTIDNMGSNNLYQFKIRAIGETGVGSDESSILDLEPLDRTTPTTYSIGGKGKISKVEVYPMTRIGICQGQLVSTSIVPAC